MVNKIKYLKEEEKEKKPLKDYILFQLVNLDVCTIGNLVTIQSCDGITAKKTRL